MSVSDAGYVINDVLNLLVGKGLFDDMSKEKASNVILDIANIVKFYNGNIDLALEGLNHKFNICRNCNGYSLEGLDEYDNCPRCNGQLL